MRLFLRADATTAMGTGHVVRCAALAEAWRAEGGEAVFITQCENAGLLERIKATGARLVRVNGPAHDDLTGHDLAGFENTSGARVVLDGYHFSAQYQKRLQSLGMPVLVIDDLAHLPHYYADAIVNQNSYAPRLDYSCEPATRLLLGTRYAMLRGDFRAWAGAAKETRPQARNLLVTMGGSDPQNVTAKVIEGLRQVQQNLATVIVVGAANPHLSAIRDLSASLANAQLVVNATHMAELMHQADLAVTAAGTTCWEMAFMRVPMITIVVADNQKTVGADVHELGVGWNLGEHAQVTAGAIAEAIETLCEDVPRRAQMAQRGGELVDGFGVQRVTQALKAM